MSNKINWQEPENLNNLLTKTTEELSEIYPEQDKDSLRRTKSRYSLKYADRLQEDLPKVAEQLITDKDALSLHAQLSKAIDDYNIDPRTVQGFKITSGFHSGYIKDSNNEIEYTEPLERKGITLQVKARDFEPAWPVVDKAPFISDFKAPQIRKDKDGRVAVILPDPQIGFLQYEDGTLDPFHDNSAISIALQLINDLKPDLVLCLGDFLDLPVAGTYEQSPEFARTTQKAVNYGYQLLAKIRTLVPDAEIVVIEGNHDRRMEKALKRNAMFAFGLRKANDFTGWPVLSVPYLCAFDDLHVKYVEGYPAGSFWINERLQAIHGHLVDSAGSTAKKVSLNERVSTIFGHVHRVEAHYKTVNVYDGFRTNAAFSPGCLCRIDGAVPSAKGSTDLSGRPIKKYEDWQQGLAVVNYKPGDGAFNYQQVFINTLNDYETSFNGSVYHAIPALLQ